MSKKRSIACYSSSILVAQWTNSMDKEQKITGWNLTDVLPQKQVFGWLMPKQMNWCFELKTDNPNYMISVINSGIETFSESFRISFLRSLIKLPRNIFREP